MPQVFFASSTVLSMLLRKTFSLPLYVSTPGLLPKSASSWPLKMNDITLTSNIHSLQYRAIIHTAVAALQLQQHHGLQTAENDALLQVIQSRLAILWHHCFLTHLIKHLPPKLWHYSNSLCSRTLTFVPFPSTPCTNTAIYPDTPGTLTPLLRYSSLPTRFSNSPRHSPHASPSP